VALLAGDVIEDARDMHPAFDKNRNPQKVVRRALSRYVGYLLGKIDLIDESGLSLEVSTAMPLAVFANGIVLPANRGVREVVAVDAAGKRYPIDIIPVGQRNDRQTRVASAWIVNGVLYLNGSAATWNGVTSIAVSYTPLAGLVVADTDLLAVPDNARSACAEAVALFMARRGQTDKDGDLPPIVLQDFIDRAKQAEAAFLEEVGDALSSQTFRVRDVWPGTR
jgi:hypothetical protein